MTRASQHNLVRRTRGGFTLIEVLATLLLVGIVLPVTMRGVSLALAAASNARHVAEATALAESKLSEITTDSLSATTDATGDFGAEHPGYTWQSQRVSRDYGLTEIVLRVSWAERGQTKSLTISTLRYESGTTEGFF